MSEVWKDIPGLVGRYMVSSLGRVKSLPKKCGTVVAGERVMRQSLTPKGYLRIDMQDANGARVGAQVHRLVCAAFVGVQPSPAHVVNHIDGKKTNNLPENLEWVTVLENARHASGLGLLRCHRGEKHPNSKLNEASVRKIRKLCAGGADQDEVASEFNVSQALVSAVHLRKSWRHVA